MAKTATKAKATTKAKKAAATKAKAKAKKAEEDFTPEVEIEEVEEAVKVEPHVLVPLLIKSNGIETVPEKGEDGIVRHFVHGSVTTENGYQKFKVECDRQVMVTESIHSVMQELVKYQQGNN